jgi:hypothetical protein
MYALIHNLKTRVALVQESSTFVVSLAIAEVFYKFHSFSLECLAFLATWGVLSGLVDGGRRFVNGASLADQGRDLVQQ